jgi:hypothetical protein
VTGQPLAGGLTLVDADPGMLIAFNAAPGTIVRQYIPMPPGIVYYDLVEVTPDGQQKVWVPLGKPMARIAHNSSDEVLTDEEIIGLLQDLKRVVIKRGLAVDWDNLEPRSATGIADCTGFREAAE